MKKVYMLLSIMLLSSFIVSCNKINFDYINESISYQKTIGDLINNESLEDLATIYGDKTATDINVLPVDLGDDFILGVDISSVIAVEEAGGVYYNADGQEQDVFEILKEHGVNYVRIRLWNEPYTADGQYYGGGNNDIETALQIAKRADRVDMGIVLDFHYSDFWADPSKQTVPRAWADYSLDELREAIYTYTYDTLMIFEDEGVRPDMVQIGNEINNGLLWPKGRSKASPQVAKFVQSGIDAVNDISDDIKTVIHLAEGASEQEITHFFNSMINSGVDFDVIGLSYYSFWHGTMTEFEETLSVLDKIYEQEIAVMEYSYGFTDLEANNAIHIYNSELETLGGYNTSMQGQASYIRDVNNAIASIESGIGSFYWEPAWLPVAGAGWASENAREYLEKQGDASSSLEHVSWANQALFSYSGKVLPSLNVFLEMKTSAFNSEEIIDYEDEINIIVNLAEDDGLPKYVYTTTSLDRFIKAEVTWDEQQVNAMESPGSYTINGTIESSDITYDVTCYAEAYVNYLYNASFEDNSVVADVKDFTTIDAWEVTQSSVGVVKIESKNPRKADNDGHNNANIWLNSAYELRLYQTVTLPQGTYQLSVWARSATDSAEFPIIDLFAESSGAMIETASITYGTSWSEWVQTTLTFSVAEETTVVVGVEGYGDANSWAHYDDFALQIVN